MSKATWRERHAKLPFVQLHSWLLRSPAWLDLSPNARCVYVALKERYNGGNNGRISFSAREAGDAIKASHQTGARALVELIEHGFLAVTETSTFKRTKWARQYLLTETKDDRPGVSPIALKTFMRWRPENNSQSHPWTGSVSPMDHRRAKSA